MNPKYVVSLELAKKMKELNFKQESEFYWVERFRQDTPDYVPYYVVETEGIPYRDSRNGQNIIVSAFTVGELGEMLPYKKCQTIFKNVYRNGKIQYLFYAETEPKELLIEADTEANARAEMLIWLKENKKI